MMWGYPYFRKPPYLGSKKSGINWINLNSCQLWISCGDESNFINHTPCTQFCSWQLAKTRTQIISASLLGLRQIGWFNQHGDILIDPNLGWQQSNPLIIRDLLVCGSRLNTASCWRTEIQCLKYLELSTRWWLIPTRKHGSLIVLRVLTIEIVV